MEHFGPETYGERVADVYDEWYKSLDRVRLAAAVFDAKEQRVDTTQIRITEGGIRLVHAKLRFAMPPELDLMARLAGLTLEDRWATFDKRPFTGESGAQVCVYRA